MQGGCTVGLTGQAFAVPYQMYLVPAVRPPYTVCVVYPYLYSYTVIHFNFRVFRANFAAVYLYASIEGSSCERFRIRQNHKNYYVAALGAFNVIQYYFYLLVLTQCTCSCTFFRTAWPLSDNVAPCSSVSIERAKPIVFKPIVSDFDFGKIKTMPALGVSQYSLLYYTGSGKFRRDHLASLGQILLVLCICTRVSKPVVVVPVVSHIQRMGCQPQKTTLHDGQPCL